MYSREYIRNSKIFKEFCKKRNISKSTQETMLTSFIKYCNIHNMSLQELHDEADNEEEQGVRHKKRKITDRLELFRQTLIEENYSTNTITESFGRVKTFYKTFRLEIPYITPLKLPQRQIMYDDIPNKEHIKKAIDSTNNLLLKAIILFMYSSCSAMAETLSINCQMFVDATKEYHDKEDINDVLRILERQKEEIIPFFLLSRQKKSNTIEKGYKYYTCCTPEATRAIITYLQYRSSKEEIHNESKLFDIEITGLLSSFSRLNDKLGWGKVGDFRFFRSHAMRIAGNTAIEEESVGDLFSGRKRNRIHEGYFKKNPQRIKELYMKYISQLSIQDTKVHDIKSKEYLKLEKENVRLKEDQRKTNDRLAQIESKLTNIDPSRLEQLLNQK